jgi:FkbM family methyltransferase
VVIPGDVVSDEIIVAGLYEETVLVPLFRRFLVPWASNFTKGVALDVGANIGNHAMYFLRHFAKVIAFEPNPVALAVLRCNVVLADAETRVQVMPFGLGVRAETLNFRHDQAGNLGGSGFEAAGAREGCLIACEMRRGDDLLSTVLKDDDSVAMIKLDIEGGEFAALQGLRSTIVRHKPVILFESHRATGQGGSLEIFTYLRSLGYCAFYAVEEMGIEGAGPLRRLASRIVRGERMGWNAITHPRNRFYQLIAALPDAGAKGPAQ